MEFNRWVFFLNKWSKEEVETPSKIEHYLAEIVAELRRQRFPKKASSIKTKPIDFHVKGKAKKRTKADRRKSILDSKLARFAAAGMELPEDVQREVKEVYG